MNKNKILDKIKKMKAIINDQAAPGGEKEVAKLAIERIFKKYPDIEYIDEIEEKELFNTIKAKDQYEHFILSMICYSYGVEMYQRKHHSKLNIVIKATQRLYELITEEYEYHKNITGMQLKMFLTAYIHKFIYEPESEGEGREVTKEEYDTYSNAANFFSTKDFYNKLRIEE